LAETNEVANSAGGVKNVRRDIKKWSLDMSSSIYSPDISVLTKKTYLRSALSKMRKHEMLVAGLYKKIHDLSKLSRMAKYLR
jgi:hypothetical protein